MSEELKPCPFCGSKATHPEGMVDDCVCCENRKCTAWGFPSTTKQWQSRPLENALRKQLEELRDNASERYDEMFNHLSAERDALRKKLEIARKGLEKAKIHAHDEYPKGTKKECSGCIAETTLTEIAEMEKQK